MSGYIRKDLYVLVIFFFLIGTKATQAQTLVIDNFDKAPKNISTKHPRYTGIQEGYDIYYVTANVRLSHEAAFGTFNPKNNILKIEFDLPPAFSWGNWLGIRREFESPVDLSRHKGLTFNLKVEVPAPEAFLRITLSDLTNNENLKDEMWWLDCDKSLLSRKTDDWILVDIPFDRFILSHGSSARHNDGKMNLSRTIAYEINIVSEQDEHPNGVILLDELHAYIEITILFDFDRFSINHKYYNILDNYADYLKQNPDIKLEIQGHTDNEGSKEYNMILSQRRASEVMLYLLKKGIDKERIFTVGFGYLKPLVSNETEWGRAQNRRVQFRFHD